MQFLKNDNQLSMHHTQASVISSFGKLEATENGAKFTIKVKYLARIRKTGDTSSGLGHIFTSLTIAMARINAEVLIGDNQDDYMGVTLAAGAISEAFLPMMVIPDYVEDEIVFLVYREAGKLMTKISIVRGEKIVMGWMEMPAPVVEMKFEDPPGDSPSPDSELSTPE